ncbi:hypothetical protein GCM10023175_28830 [Pseudonocardia xishanensis]|uniref:Uncharacterized protein n=1 Tax=Pseudonocardia xishanensis TaxID=630995 RepID=A0ABP8RT11_9PSEU
MKETVSARVSPRTPICGKAAVCWGAMNADIARTLGPAEDTVTKDVSAAAATGCRIRTELRLRLH